jgi:hypothetical protein
MAGKKDGIKISICEILNTHKPEACVTLATIPLTVLQVAQASPPV